MSCMEVLFQPITQLDHGRQFNQNLTKYMDISGTARHIRGEMEPSFPAKHFPDYSMSGASGRDEAQSWGNETTENNEASSITTRPLSPDTSGFQRSTCRLRKMKSRSMHHISSRCVMFNYFDGETSNEVDEHFTRALNHDNKSTPKDDSSPMIRRNFPPSFWDSNYKPPIKTTRSFSANDVIRGMTSSINQTSSMMFLPSHPTTIFGSFPPTFDPYPSIQGGFPGDPWQPYNFRLPPTPSYPNRNLPNIYGLSAAALAATQSRYSLMMPPVAGARQPPTSLMTSRADDVGREGLWPVSRYSGIRF
uniref:Transcription cofactor vestigial-like protein 2 n=1 Tax=Ciona intestinalis TaxID=7719 RepID=F7BNR7_CIOIN|nr:transcription cofactor vestigial-like protein 2 [Ciona intestinalis]|eukprot:XP_002128412.1 transcription cofactor vestigial-like protein 2 [Ciona intestinalis]